MVRVSRELNSIVDLKTLVEVILDEAMRTTRAACGAVLLFDPGDLSIPVAASSSAGCSLPESLPGLHRKVLASGEGLLIGDTTGTEQAPGHEGVLSAVLVPILDQASAVGLIEMHSTQTGFIDQSTLDVLQKLASHTAAALENIQKYQEQLQRTELLRRRSERLTRITEVSYGLHFHQPLDQLLRTIADSIREATPFQAVLISIYDRAMPLLPGREIAF